MEFTTLSLSNSLSKGIVNIPTASIYTSDTAFTAERHKLISRIRMVLEAITISVWNFINTVTKSKKYMYAIFCRQLFHPIHPNLPELFKESIIRTIRIYLCQLYKQSTYSFISRLFSFNSWYLKNMDTKSITAYIA